VAGGDPAGLTPDGRMTLVEHLYELRSRLARSMLAIAVAVVVVFILWEPVFEFLKAPYCATGSGEKAGCDLVSIQVFDQFKVRLRVAFIGGIVASSPVWLYQIGAFITPALHRKERRYAAAFLAASLVLFAVGAAFAYLTISRGLDFLLSVGGDGITTLVGVQSYLSFVTLCLLAFGVAFEFPVVVLFLHFVGVLSADRMRAARRGTVVGLFAFSALITPSQDPITFVAMAGPLCLLYELCILIARVRERRSRKRSRLQQAELDDDTPSVLDAAPSPLPAAASWRDDERSRL
jgi:sec-independent protein translocase protein TatC